MGKAGAWGVTNTSKRRCDLTIIIPHFNAPGDLRRLLESIGVRDGVQVIVVDDFSDQYLEELNECKAEFDNVLFLETAEGKKGAGAARNTGLERAEGEWLLFADCDDVFLPGWYEVISPYMESDCDLVYFAPVSKRRDGSGSNRHERYKKLIDDYLSSSYGGEERLRGHFSVPWSKLVRADLVSEHGIRFDEVFYSADVMFSAKVGYFAEIIAADTNPIYCIIDHDDSMSRTKSGEVYCRRQQIYCRRDCFFRKRLSGEQFSAYGRMSFLYSAAEALRKGYGWRTVIEMAHIYRKYRIPFAVFNYRKYASGAADRLSGLWKRVSGRP